MLQGIYLCSMVSSSGLPHFLLYYLSYCHKIQDNVSARVGQKSILITCLVVLTPIHGILGAPFIFYFYIIIIIFVNIATECFWRYLSKYHPLLVVHYDLSTGCIGRTLVIYPILGNIEANNNPQSITIIQLGGGV